MMIKNKKVMIADDDAGIVDSLSLILKFEGYEVSTTMDGALLLNMHTDLPDLLILDIWMSGIDGRDVCKHLKEQEHTSKLPIVMISASRDIERSAMDAGADDFLAKPFEIDDLLEKVEKNMR